MSGNNNIESSSASSVEELLAQKNPSRRHSGTTTLTGYDSDDMAIAYAQELERQKLAQIREDNAKAQMGQIARDVMATKDRCEFCKMYSFVQAQTLPPLRSTVDLAIEDYYPQYAGIENMNLRRHIADAHPDKVKPALLEHAKFVEYNQLLTWLRDLAHRSKMTTDEDQKTELGIKIKRVIREIHELYTSSDKTKEIIDRHLEEWKKEKEREQNNNEESHN
jgi:hypothetical protein